MRRIFLVAARQRIDEALLINERAHSPVAGRVAKMQPAGRRVRHLPDLLAIIIRREEIGEQRNKIENRDNPDAEIQRPAAFAPPPFDGPRFDYDFIAHDAIAGQPIA